MFKHIVKLIWNRRSKNILLMIEIFVCFLILFGVLSFSIQQYDRYTVPLGFETNNVWIAKFNVPVNSDSTTVVETKRAIFNEVRSLTEVSEVSYTSGTIPYGGSMWTMADDEGGIELDAHYFKRDENYAKVANMNIVKGRWFQESDYADKYIPAVVNQHFVDEFFKDSSMIGRHIKLNDDYKIVGVVDNYRYQGEFSEDQNGLFAPFEISDISSDPILNIALKTDVDPFFEKKLNDVITEAAGDFQFSVSDMDQLRERNSMQTWITIIALIVICSFLIFNVMLGLFGVLWYNIKKRRGEIGLRKAMGATKSLITTHFVGEMLVVAGFGVVLGLFFAFQFPLLNIFSLADDIYFRAIIIAVFIVLSLVLFCAFLPSRQAANVAPAVALHDE